jgi:broad specificity phosphatase PhoE
MAVEIIYETHSLTEDNENGIATGWLPGRLSGQGRRFAAELGTRRRVDDLAAVFVSDLHRAVETAQIAFADTPIPIYRDPRLRECNYGELNGCPVTVLAAQRARHIDQPFPGGQSYRQILTATGDFCRTWRKTGTGNACWLSPIPPTSGPSIACSPGPSWKNWSTRPPDGEKVGPTSSLLTGPRKPGERWRSQH